MKILVTGGAGFIGSMLTPLLLNEGHAVHVLDNLQHGSRSLLGVWAHPDFTFFYGDVRDAQLRERALAGCDAVVHLAAIVGDPACARHPELARAVNYDASSALVQDSRRHGVGRFLFASTCSNYGRMADPLHYVDETSALHPISLYAETKVSVEQLLLDPGQTGAMCTTALRFATVFGISPRPRFDLTVNEFAVAMIKHKYLQVYGEQFWRPYIHVRDVARGVACVLAADAGAVDHAVFNLGATEQNYTNAAAR